jgi:TonB family protein
VSHAAVHPPETASAREAASGFTFHKEDKKGSKTALIGGLAALLLIAAAGAAFVLKGRGATAPAASTVPPPTTMSAEMTALAQRARDLEAKLQALEAEKAAASAKAEEDARKKVEAQAKARGQAVDPEALARAQEEARKKAQAEQDRKALADRKRLEDEQKLAEAQLAEEQRRAEEARAAAAAAAAAAPPTTEAAAPPPPPPTTLAIKPGTLVDVNDVGVIAPVALNKPSFTYPPIALRQRIEGKVDLSVLVDERGSVADARVVSGAGGRAGLNEAASDYVRRWKFRPATKEGVPVKTWTPVSVVFMLPR